MQFFDTTPKVINGNRKNRKKCFCTAFNKIKQIWCNEELITEKACYQVIEQKVINTIFPIIFPHFPAWLLFLIAETRICRSIDMGYYELQNNKTKWSDCGGQLLNV